ncbi:MAG TPA: leucine-rich repeat domain-containing protein [Acholeplasmataceae bacterium]|nr:leucine-rich repeat domain-containing protein [Acholeplasmataceae bacterium]
MGQEAFSGCTNLSQVNLPETITKIEEWAFFDCEKLETIFIPLSVRAMEANVFRNCFQLEIYVEAQTIPYPWKNNWNPSNCPFYLNPKP